MGIDLDPYLDPSEAAPLRGRGDPGPRRAGPIWLGCGRLIYYKGFSGRDPGADRGVPGTLLLVGDGPDRAALCRPRPRALGLAGPGRLPRRETYRPTSGDRPLLPRGRRLLVPVDRPERGVRPGPGRGDGVAGAR